MLVNVYSAYDNFLLFSGNPKEVADEFEIGLSTVYTQCKKKKLTTMIHDFYCTIGDPIPHEVIDVYDCYTLEKIDTCYNMKEVAEKYNMCWNSAYLNSKGDLNRYTTSGYRFQKRIV